MQPEIFWNLSVNYSYFNIFSLAVQRYYVNINIVENDYSVKEL